MTLRTLQSAALASLIFATDFCVLTMFLNPEVTLRRDGIGLLEALFFPYFVASTAIGFFVACAGRTLGGRKLSLRPPIDSLPWLATLIFLSVLACCALFWSNLLAYRHSIPLEALRGLAGASIAVTGCGLVLVAVGVDALLFPLRSRGASAALVVLAGAGAVVVPLALRPIPLFAQPPLRLAMEPVEPVRRIILVGIDGLGPEQIRDGISTNSLPGFARIVRHGAYGPMATLTPTDGPPIWNTILTGRLPRDHGVKGFATYRLGGSRTVCELLPRGAFVGVLERWGLLSTTPVTSAARKRRALWNDLNAFSIQAGVVRVWGTYPTEKVMGFMLSHYFHLLCRDPTRVGETLYPRDLINEVVDQAVDPSGVDPALVSQFVDPSVDIVPDGVPWRRELLERALAPDLTYQNAGTILRRAYDPPFFVTYFYGLDVVGHTFTRFAQPDRFGNVGPKEARKYGKVTDRYAALLSQWVGDMVQGLRPREILFVVSGYGMEPVPLWRRLLAPLAGVSNWSGTHGGAPDGVILAVGDGIRPGSLIHNASVLNITPTLLYLMGLPVARDMEGRVLTEILEGDFAQSHPVTFIPSYESLALAPSDRPGDVNLPPIPDEGP